MRSRESQLPLYRRVLATGALFGVSVSGAACTSGESAPQTLTPPTTSYTFPAEGYVSTLPPVTAATIPLPACTEDASVVLPGDFSTSLISPSDYTSDMATDVPNGQIDDVINLEHPTATPTEFANYYFDMAGELLRGQIEVVLDDSLQLGEWPDESTATTVTLYDGSPYTEKQRAQSELILKLNTIIHQLSRYPDNLYSAFGVERMRLADIYTNYGGHYNTSANELSFEFDAENAKPRWIYTYLAHELGHAYHDRYCGGNVANDPLFSGYNSLEYIGYVDNLASQEEVNAHNALVPEALYGYGPTREFVQPYAAYSPMEDFATVVEWTLADRGLIREGDADYGSPLYHKQQLVVQRIDAMIPGFAAFADNITASLRLQATNEVYSANTVTQVAITRQELFDEVAFHPDGLMLNGIRSVNEWSETPYTRLIAYPLLNLEKSGTELNIPIITTNGHADMYTPVEKDETQDVVIELFVPKDKIVNGAYTGDLLVPSAELPPLQPGISANQNVESEDFNALGPLKTLAFEADLVPIYVIITS